jgi:hypothetical protein
MGIRADSLLPISRLHLVSEGNRAGSKFPHEFKLNTRGWSFTGCYNSQFRSRIVQLPDLRTEGMTAEEAIFVRSQTLNGAKAR